VSTSAVNARSAGEGEGWDAAAAEWPGGDAPLWRLQSDAVNGRLLERWLPPRLDSVLKTDLFDEFVSPGLLPELRRRARVVTGIDLSAEVVTGAGERNPAPELIRADVRELPFPDMSFDAVVSNSTLDHFEGPHDVRLALREISRVLVPGGRLVLTLDNPWNPAIALRNRLPGGLSRRLRRGFAYRAGWTCGPRPLRGLLTEAGLDVSQTTAVLHAPRALVAALPAPRSAAARRRTMRALLGAERLEALPSRYLTGHFVAALAVKPEA